MPKNKVQFNLKNVHYAPMTDTTAPAWDTPVPVPGAVSLALEQQGSVSPFYADGIVYFQSASNSGYSGDLEMALFPDQMLEDIWGMTLTDTDNVLIENANVKAKSFALLFQIDGDTTQQFYLLYNCTGTRPGIGSKTNGDTVEPQTQKTTISAAPLPNGNVMAKTTDTTTEEVREAWFTKVYENKVMAKVTDTTTVEAEE